ncbi:Era-like GTP-binding protein [Methanocaldococcus infernus]
MKFKIAIIGPENAGKSSIMNALFGKYISLVSEVGGTTKMPVKRYWGKIKVSRLKENPIFAEIMFSDLSGLYRGNNKEAVLSKKVLEETYKEIESSDMIINVVDATQGLIRNFEKLHHLLKFRYQKPIIVVVNKYDLINDTIAENLRNRIRERLKAEPIFVSAKTGENIDVLIETIINHIRKVVEC